MEPATWADESHPPDIENAPEPAVPAFGSWGVLILRRKVGGVNFKCSETNAGGGFSGTLDIQHWFYHLTVFALTKREIAESMCSTN